MAYGTVAPGWEVVKEAFERVLQIDEAGGAVSVVHKGRTVVDLWGGSDPLSGRAWDADSVTCGFSVTKGIVGLLLAQEVAKGTLDPFAPVAQYWPEFAAAGKAKITVREVFTHAAAMPEMGVSDFWQIIDQQAVAAHMATMAPAFAPGTARVYHALSYGTLTGEILRRVTGKDVGQLVAERFAEPLDLALWVGQPETIESQYRPGLMGVVEPPEPPTGSCDRHDACWASYRSNAELTPVFSRVNGQQGTEPFNTTEFRSRVIPGGGVVTNARSLARLYAAAVDELHGVRIVDEQALALLSRDWSRGTTDPDCLATLIAQVPWGIGVELSNSVNPMLGPGSFGHAGMGGRLAFAHIPSKTGFGFISQRMFFPEPAADPRWHELLPAVQQSLGLVH